MSCLKMLLQKSKDTLREDGVKIFCDKAVNYIRKTLQKEDHADSPEKMFMDVLFVNGCFLPHPSRYRVSHQREQLLAGNVTSNEVFYEDITLDLVKRYRVFVFFRCPYTEMIGEFIKQAKAMNKRVLFDIDDLVIDRKYTDQIPYLRTMSKEDKQGYDSGVEKMQKTLRLCDAAITTTRALAEELRQYVSQVFINRNVASDRMVHLSEEAIYMRDILPHLEGDEIPHEMRKKASVSRKQAAERQECIRIGYFSGSITHNDDIEMILPVLVKILKENTNVELHIAGELDIPGELEPYRSQIKCSPFVNWEKLPQRIASVDINIAPLCDTIFNAAKSENKWMEAALVKVPTIASNVGAMSDMIQDKHTGFLCSSTDEWYRTLTQLIRDNQLREEIGEKAYRYVKKHCQTVYTSYGLTQFIKSQMTPNIAFVLPSIQTSGGVLVALKHALIMREAGYDVLILNEGVEEKNVEYLGQQISVLSTHKTQIHSSIDKAVATLWTTLNFIRLYPGIQEKYYLVQGYETDFYQPGRFFRFSANQTYFIDNLCYITVSKWCQRWLVDDYHRTVRFAPNGIDITRFTPKKRIIDKKKVRILVEGNSDDYYKNVDEAFQIIQNLPEDKYEIWFMSYQGKPKDWYRVDCFLHRVPYADVPSVYSQCDILLKTSILESFSYPPLEMMATGGYVVVAPNDGNIEYLRDGKNCMMYSQGDIGAAVAAIEKIVRDYKIQEKLYEEGIKTANSRDWEQIKNDIVHLYEK